MCDLLCSGPIERFDKERITEESLQVVDRNSDYYLYTYKAVCDFLERNRLVSVIRAHQMQMAGSVEPFYVSPEVPVGSNCV